MKKRQITRIFHGFSEFIRIIVSSSLRNLLFQRSKLFLNLRQPNLRGFLDPIRSGADQFAFNVILLSRECLATDHCFSDTVIPFLRASGVTLSADLHSKKVRGTWHINMFHNQPIKITSVPRKRLLDYDEFFSWGQFQSDYIEDLYKRANLPLPRITSTGCPKLDPLFVHYDKDLLLKRFSFRADRPTVAYAPSWDKGLSLHTMGDEIITTLLQSDCNVILRLHPASLFPITHKRSAYFTNDVDWAKKISAWQSQIGGFHDSRGDEEYVLMLQVSDLLITDHSSVAWDVIAIGKPCITVHSPEFFRFATGESAKRFGNPTKDELLDNPFYNAGRNYTRIIETMAELHSILRSLKEGAAPAMNYPSDLSDYLLSNKGRATEAALITISERFKSYN